MSHDRDNVALQDTKILSRHIQTNPMTCAMVQFEQFYILLKVSAVEFIATRVMHCNASICLPCLPKLHEFFEHCVPVLSAVLLVRSSVLTDYILMVSDDCEA